MRTAGHFRNWTCGAIIGIAAACFISAAAADDGEVCVRGSGNAAIEACTRALNSGRFDRRNMAVIYSNRGNQRERMGEFDKAIADHDEAIRTDPTYAAGFMHRGNAYARHGDFERAIADHTEAIRLGPKDANAFYNRGYTYSRKGDHEHAVADYTSGIRTGRQQFTALGSALLVARRCRQTTARGARRLHQGQQFGPRIFRKSWPIVDWSI